MFLNNFFSDTYTIHILFEYAVYVQTEKEANSMRLGRVRIITLIVVGVMMLAAGIWLVYTNVNEKNQTPKGTLVYEGAAYEGLV